jgi:hypothetical protein
MDAIRAPTNLQVDYITMICIQFGSLNTIHYAGFNNSAEYTSLYTSKMALKMFFSTHLSTISSMLPIPLIYTFRTWLTLCSQVSSQEASKYTPSIIPDIPPRTFSSTSAKVQIDYRLRYAHTRTRAAHSKLPVDPCATRSL